MLSKTLTHHVKYLSKYSLKCQTIITRVSSEKIWFFGIVCTSVAATILGLCGIKKLTSPVKKQIFRDATPQVQSEIIIKFISKELQPEFDKLQHDLKDFREEVQKSNDKLEKSLLDGTDHTT